MREISSIDSPFIYCREWNDFMRVVKIDGNKIFIYDHVIAQSLSLFLIFQFWLVSYVRNIIYYKKESIQHFAINAIVYFTVPLWFVKLIGIYDTFSIVIINWWWMKESNWPHSNGNDFVFRPLSFLEGTGIFCYMLCFRTIIFTDIYSRYLDIIFLSINQYDVYDIQIF